MKRIIKVRLGIGWISKIVQRAFDLTDKNAHIYARWGYLRRAQEVLSVILGFGDGRFKRMGSVVDTPSAIAKTTAVRIKMGESRHDIAASWPIYPVFLGNKMEISDFLSKTIIREAFKRV